MEVIRETLAQHAAALRDRCQELQAECLRAKTECLRLQAALAARPRAVEKYYSPHEVALLLGFSEAWARRQIVAGNLPGTVALDRDMRVPASSINAFLEARQHHALPTGISARTAGELRRKAGRFISAE